MAPRLPSHSARARRKIDAPRAACVLGTVFALTGAAAVHAQTTSSTSPPAPAASSSGLTWNGITLYGIVDVGIQYDEHGAPFSDYFQAGSSDIIQKYSRQGVLGVTSSNLSQSRIGLQGNESLGVGDLAGVFKVETYFNPANGNISDALHSLTQNNGRTLGYQNVNLDSSIAGEIFEQSFAGLSSPTYGTLTFGRQNTVLADGIAKYDPNATSYAFSLIGLSGTGPGGGDTQDRRFDSSIKYSAKFANIFHVAAQYKFSDASNAANSASQVMVGAEYAGLSVDAFYSNVRSAISVSALSAAQVATLPALGISPDKALVGTISDNKSESLMASYALGPAKLFGGWQYIKYENPSTPLPVGFDDIGGYKLAVVNNTAYAAEEKILQVYWAGVKYTAMPKLDVVLAYYGYHQGNYATGATLKGCQTNKESAGTCSGELIDLSADAVYHLSKHFDGYVGLMYTDVQDGLANGYIKRNTVNETVGVRFSF